MDTTANRINKVINEKAISQADLVRECAKYASKYNETITRQNISHYCTGKYIPKGGKLSIIAAALDVSETWLLGMDVPRERPKHAGLNDMTVEESTLIIQYRKLDQYGKTAIDALLDNERKRCEEQTAEHDATAVKIAQADKIIKDKEEADRNAEKVKKEEPVLMAAHNDSNDPDQIALMRKDIEMLKKIMKDK